MKGRPGDFDKIVLSRDSRWLAGMGSKGGATLWDLRVRDPSAAIRPLPGDPRVVAFSPDGYWLTAGGSDKTIRVFDLRGTEPLARPVLLSADRPIDAIDFSPDGRWLVTRGDRQVALWDLRAKLTGATPQILRGKTHAIAISPNGHWLATSSQFSVSGMPILWDMTAKDPSASFTVLGPNITGEVAAISSDSRWLIFEVFQRIPEFQDKLGAYKSTGLWDLTARDPAVTRIVLPGFEAPIGLSPDGHRLATYNENKEKISLWDLADSGPGPPVVLPEFASTVTFTPDGHWMAASGRDTVDLWNLRLEELATPACRAAGRNLTLEEWGHYFFGQPYHKTCPDLPAPIMGGKEVEAAYATAGLVTLAESAIQAGDVKGASSAYLQATRGAVENGGFEANGEICLFGSFNALAQVVMPACERVVVLAPDKGESRAIRGLARGASGNRLGAIEDLAFAVTNLQEGQVFDRKQLEAWLAELRKGHNPFDAQALKKLKTLVQGR
jgi:hypothetical protein